jgi:SP family general alpha glucoside:H+ symporter-like MFS transporter
MEAYCVFLMGSFVALPAFRSQYGIPDGSGGMVIAPSWQSALQCGGPVGALVGVFIAGPLAAWIGYRWATIAGLMGLNGTIFVMFFADSLPIFFLSQLLEGMSFRIDPMSKANKQVYPGESSSPSPPHTVARLSLCD